MRVSREKTDAAVFRIVQHMPTGELLSLSFEALERIRGQLGREVREVGRALMWVDGAIRLKQEKEQRGRNA